MVPEPVKLEILPLPTVTSPDTKPVTFSEKVTVKGIGVVPVPPPLAPAEELMTTVGRTVSTVKVFVFELALTAEPPAWAVAYTVWLPCDNAVDWGNEKAPPEATVTAMLAPSTYTVTTLPAGAVPA